jgi:hypothetical protein
MCANQIATQRTSVTVLHLTGLEPKYTCALLRRWFSAAAAVWGAAPVAMARA